MTADPNTSASIAELMDPLGQAARRASRTLALTSNEHRNQALHAMAQAVRDHVDEILEANRMDTSDSEKRGLSAAMLDRLMLDGDRVESMAAAIDAIAELADPLGQVIAEWDRPNGLTIQRITVPLGVIGIIYESRPNVTADAAALCLKSGNTTILRGGSESYRSSNAIHECIRVGLSESGIDTGAVQMVATKDRDAVGYLLSSMRECRS